MSSSEFSKSATISDSNIPVPRRTHAATKRHRGCAQLPELQKYIETIIKASNECDSEEAPLSEKANRFPRERKFGRHSVLKGNDSPAAKHEKAKFELRASARKSKNKAKTPFTEAVSNADEISSTYVYDFEDPRNCHNLASKSEIENFLKQLFPNPYHLRNISEAQNVNSDVSPEKKEKDDLRDGTLVLVPISDVRTETEVDRGFVTADSEIKARGSHASCSARSDSPLENCNRPASRMGGRRESITSFRCSPKRPTTPPTETPLRSKSSNSTINVSSRASSLESVSEVSSCQSRTIVRRTKSSKSNAEVVCSKGSQNETKQKSSREDFSEDATAYYDIGKLKLLTDAEDSSSKNLRQDDLNHTSSTMLDDVYGSNDLGDLRQVLEVMKEASESSFEVGVKCEQGSSEGAVEGDKLLQFINELAGRELATRQSLDDERQARQDEWTKRIEKSCVTEKEETQAGKGDLGNDCENDAEQKKTTESSSADLSVQEENVGEEEKPSDEEEQEASSTREADANSPATLDDVEATAPPEEEDQQAEQKIDEVLQFMYDCLKKFSTQDKKCSEEAETPPPEDEKEMKNSMEDLTNVTHQQQTAAESSSVGAEEAAESSFVEISPRVKEIQSECSKFLDDSKRKPIMRPRCRKKQEKDSPLAVPAVTPPASRIPTIPRSLETHSTSDSMGVGRHNTVQTVEGQNELGSYSESAPASPFGCSDQQIVKSVLPHSVKLKKSKTDTQKTIKDVLETEEKLLANYLRLKPSEKKPVEKSTGESKGRKQGNHVVVRNGRGGGCPFLHDFRRSNSNFVICVSSLPRNLRTMAANRTSLSLSPSLSLSLSEVSKSWDLKSLPYYQKHPLKKIPVISDVGRSVLELTYGVREGVVVTVGKSHVEWMATVVYLKTTADCSRWEEELSLRNSECWISMRVKPMKKSLFVESSGASSCLIEGSGADLTDGSTSAETEGNQRVSSLLEALEKTEGRLALLEQNEFVTSSSLSSCSGNETYKCDTSEMDWERENGHERVHDLLLRTYNLQHKLHRYLYRMACVQPGSVGQQEGCLRPEDETDLGVMPGQQEKITKVVVDEATIVEVQTSDHATSYSPPLEESEKASDEIEPEAQEGGGRQNQNEEDDADDDDSSSVCSFKSSNDFSESNEMTNPEKSKTPEKPTSGQFLKKIFTEIESFRQSIKAVKKDDSCAESNHEGAEDLKENRLTEYDPKMPAKVLRTVFKGKKSLTELTIGLKDVPMTQVSNISVEKRKFSPNHTKISICILKEKPDLLEKVDNIREPMFKESANVLGSKFSTLYFDDIRPSLSRCRTEYSRLEDDISKTSESIHESSADEDEEYKSVGSSPSNPDVAKEQKEAKDNKAVVPPPPKTFTKYRFDFYRKMDMSVDSSQVKSKSNPLSSTVCRYKELEPLKQALTEMQIRMRSIKQGTFYNSNDYYDRALKLAKMSAGYCQSCGNRAVIPKDTFGYYKTLLPRRYTGHRHGRHFKMATTPDPSYYSFRSNNPEVNDNFCGLDYKHSSSYLLNHATRPSQFLRNSLHDMPILIERM